MVGKKTYELPFMKVIHQTGADVLTASGDEKRDGFFVEDSVDWKGILG